MQAARAVCTPRLGCPTARQMIPAQRSIKAASTSKRSQLTSCMACRLLALCAHLAAGLPYRRADEPHTIVFHMNLLVSRRGEDILAALKASLADSLPKSKSPGPKTTQVLF